MDILAQAGPPAATPSMFGWYVGFVIAAVVITIVVALVAAILQIARTIGSQAQMANQGLKQALENTRPLHDLETTTDIAVTVTRELNKVRMALEG
jgi:hypothetical protein